MQPLQTADETSRILERLEPAMTELDEAERDALLLRYFEDRSLREVGQELGISEDAARMRVNRALERLRTVFANQGTTVTSVLLASVLAAKEELARLQKDNTELLRLRNEVGQLRRDRDAAKQRSKQPAPPSAGSGQSAANPGRYISKDQLAFVGYATPEAALESMTWAMMNGTAVQTQFQAP